jgi:hypothetical protein
LETTASVDVPAPDIQSREKQALSARIDERCRRAKTGGIGLERDDAWRV